MRQDPHGQRHSKVAITQSLCNNVPLNAALQTLYQLRRQLPPPLDVSEIANPNRVVAEGSAETIARLVRSSLLDSATSFLKRDAMATGEKCLIFATISGQRGLISCAADVMS